MDYYIGLGDSISISSYPSLDSNQGRSALVGAVDLAGIELLERGIVKEVYNLAEDGAEINDVYTQLTKIPPGVRIQANIITLTAGGNDISFSAMRRRGQAGQPSYERYMPKIVDRYNLLVAHIYREFPNSLIIVNSLYDPTDGTGELPNCGQWTQIRDEYSRGRRELGDHIRSIWGGTDIKWNRVLFCDVFKAFDGHGMKSGCIRSNGYYYKDFLIEPGHIGAITISDLWLDAMQEFFHKAPYTASAVSFSR